MLAGHVTCTHNCNYPSSVPCRVTLEKVEETELRGLSVRRGQQETLVQLDPVDLVVPVELEEREEFKVPPEMMDVTEPKEHVEALV